MSGEVKLPFGKGREGRMVSVKDVPSGLSDLVCPGCGSRLTAVKGNIKQHHFRHHAASNNCIGARETGYHIAAKQFICENLSSFVLPDDYDHGPALSAQEEVALGEIRPDVTVQYAIEPIAVEVYVTHRRAAKTDIYIAKEHVALEIDLSQFRNIFFQSDEFKQLVLSGASRHWLNPPRKLRERLTREAVRLAAEQERQRVLAAERLALEMEQERAAEAAEQERRRVLAAERLEQQIAAEAARREEEAKRLERQMEQEAKRREQEPKRREDLRIEKEAEDQRKLAAETAWERRARELSDEKRGILLNNEASVSNKIRRQGQEPFEFLFGDHLNLRRRA